MKFKVGDRVKFIKASEIVKHTLPNLKIGDVFIIREIDSSSIPYKCIDSSNKTNWFAEEELELIADKDDAADSMRFYVDNKMEENNMSYKKILNIYKEREIKAIDESYDIQKEEILNKDKIYIEIKKSIKKINDLLEKDGQQDRLTEPSFYTYKTLETKELFEQLEVNKYEEIDELYKILDEVEARLEMTNDYDKQIEILKSYEILDEEGKINNEL